MDNSADMETAMNELDDLSNLFEFGDIDLNNIPDVDTTQYGEQLQQPSSQHGTHPNTPFHDLGDPSLLPGSAVADFAGQDHMGMMQGIDQQGQQHFLGQPAHQMPSSNGYLPEPMYQPAVSQPHQNEPFHFNGQQQHYPPSGHIPPTPNSYEMHGSTGNFVNQPQQQNFYRATMEQQRYQMQKDAQIAFTPMASPAGTPQFPMLSEFTTPGAYFSPLSSPMILAQHSQQYPHAHPQPFISHPTTAPSSAAPSPNDGSGDVEMGGSQELPTRKKSRRKPATPKSAASTGKAKPSPATRAQKRKTSAKASETDLRRAATSQPSSTSIRQPDSSEAESISPEPLSESIMGPPPRPGSTLAQSMSSEQQGPGAQAVAPAATPKSLLQRRGTQQLANGQAGTTQSPQSTGDLGGLDDLALPEAARPPAPAPINTQISVAEDETDTPRMSARKTPKFGASDTPSSAKFPSSLPSPSVAPSPATAGSILNSKTDPKTTRTTKKRGSISQTPSTKPLPRISPSIKPLLPEGSPLHSSTQALLLASKSNYQNLLEGNHLPGVSYPDSLSTGLTSKRTSHKVAEQGRRNRINDALKEMHSLVPKPSPATKAAMKEAEASSPDGGTGEDGSVTKSSSSKAATVELANEYIKKMQRESAEREAEVERLRREMEGLRRRLGEGGNVLGNEGRAEDNEGLIEKVVEDGAAAGAE